MYLNKICLSLLLITVVVSCEPNKKTVPNNKPINDTIPKNTGIVKNSDTLAANTKKPVIDTTAVLIAFKKASKTEPFTKELDFNDKNDFNGSIFDSERPIIIGDLNGDHLDDAIMPFSIEGRGGGNNWDAHYAIFINNGGTLTYQYSFDRGGDLAETQINFTSIKDGIIKGMEVPGFHADQGKSSPIEYIYRDKELSELLRASEPK